MTNKDDGKKDELLKSIQDGGEAAKTVSKLIKDKVEVDIVENQDELDMLELEESRLILQRGSLVGKDDEASKKATDDINRVLKEIESRKVEVAGKTVKAYLVPLRYREYRIVQTAVAEALISTDGMGFDVDTKIAMVIQEKKMMTVFLALRRRENVDEKFYTSLDEFVKTSDNTIDRLYSTYSKEYELTDNERKN